MKWKTERQKETSPLYSDGKIEPSLDVKGASTEEAV